MSATAEFDDEVVSREQVREWEAKRGIRAIATIRGHLGDEQMLDVLSTAGIKGSEPDGLIEIREWLAVLKREMGHDGIRAMMSGRTKRSTKGVKGVLALSRGRSILVTIDVVAEGIGGPGFLDWFMRTHDADNEAEMLAANPDHWLISRGADGTQEVIETVGNAPLPSHILIRFDDEELPALAPDPSFPAQLVGVARLPDGRITGKVRHQFRDEGNGLRARLGIEFPRAFPPWIRRAHRWHLACEFMNWIESAARDRP